MCPPFARSVYPLALSSWPAGPRPPPVSGPRRALAGCAPSASAGATRAGPSPVLLPGLSAVRRSWRPPAAHRARLGPDKRHKGSCRICPRAARIRCSSGGDWPGTRRWLPWSIARRREGPQSCTRTAAARCGMLRRLPPDGRPGSRPPPRCCTPETGRREACHGPGPAAARRRCTSSLVQRPPRAEGSARGDVRGCRSDRRVYRSAGRARGPNGRRLHLVCEAGRLPRGGDKTRPGAQSCSRRSGRWPRSTYRSQTGPRRRPRCNRTASSRHSWSVNS